VSQAGNLYEDRKLDGKCTRCGSPADGDSLLCVPHREADLKYQRKSKKKLRRQRRKEGRCAMCGCKADLYRCLPCQAKHCASSVTGVSDGVQKFDEQLERIRSRTFLEADGRVRYRGRERRGRQSVADLDSKDLALVRTYLAKYEAAIDYARRPEAADVPRIQRDEAVRAANDYLRLAGRFANDILVRNGEPPIVAVPDDDDDDEGDDE